MASEGEAEGNTAKEIGGALNPRHPLLQSDKTDSGPGEQPSKEANGGKGNDGLEQISEGNSVDGPDHRRKEMDIDVESDAHNGRDNNSESFREDVEVTRVGVKRKGCDAPPIATDEEDDIAEDSTLPSPKTTQGRSKSKKKKRSRKQTVMGKHAKENEPLDFEYINVDPWKPREVTLDISQCPQKESGDCIAVYGPTGEVTSIVPNVHVRRPWLHDVKLI